MQELTVKNIDWLYFLKNNYLHNKIINHIRCIDVALGTDLW